MTDYVVKDIIQAYAVVIVFSSRGDVVGQYAALREIAVAVF